MTKHTERATETKTDAPADIFESILEEREVAAPETKGNDPWLAENFEGQLAVDVFQTETEIVIQSTLAGVRVEDIDISVNNDMVTIRGIRQHEQSVKPDDYFYQECYWGGFSRSIILPVDVKGDKVTATLKNGILTVTLPKATTPRTKTVRVREEFDDTE